MKKIKNGLLLTMLTVLTLGMGNLNANAVRINPKECKDGKLYTNYYYLVAAEVFTGTNAEVATNIQNRIVRAQGIFRNNIIKVDSLKYTGFQNYGSDIRLDKGKVSITSGPTDGINNININDFYTKLQESKNTTDGSWTEKDGVTSRIVKHTYKNVSEDLTVSDEIKNSLNLMDTPVSDLVKASIKIDGISISYVEVDDTQNPEKEITIQATRDYANPTGFTGAWSTVTPVHIGDYNWYLQPAAYYVQYCEAGDGSSTKTVKYDANTTAKVTNMPSEKSDDADACIEISDKIPVRDGYVFTGWSTDKNADESDKKYAAGKEYCDKESITLYAVWVDEDDFEFTITYDANGGTDAPKKQVGGTDCLKISSSKPKQTGNNFLGWSTDKDAKEPDKKYAADKEYCGESGDLKLYAVWQTQTGVSAHVIAFVIAGFAAVAALVVAKKKDLFKQI